MGRRMATRTKHFCDVKIRKNSSRYFVRNGKHMVRYTTGAYYPATSTIGMRADPNYCKDYPDYEDRLLETFLHEMNHWATFLYIPRSEWEVMYDGRKGKSRDEMLLERIANYPLGNRKCQVKRKR